MKGAVKSSGRAEKSDGEKMGEGTRRICGSQKNFVEKIICYAVLGGVSFLFANNMAKIFVESNKFKNYGFYQGGKYYPIGNLNPTDNQIRNYVNTKYPIYHQQYGTRTDYFP
ncbi:hypothetical protein MBCUT_17000 [Methanobrevibacter cuticularis]|uniref:Uncharacterized protein n=1 Tax=Methanobrevibacter cuticularis TaxID=47311 RepID=A0A166D2G5_9EURY|nr:hypothetical protein [Methanobrevibacter cuticularis]KZX15140.1 hypothetical protein MBCUT_17000 [Methanobrevibacter cuticularis]